MFCTNYRFCDFVKDTGKGVFVDIEFHPIPRHLFKPDEAYAAYAWAIQMLPLLLDNSGYSEELIVYARQTRLRRNNHYLDFTYLSSEQHRRSVQAAVKAYLRRVEDEWN
ncbi:hypothetical protein CVT25_001181 [Psilocybe cyanescens]|uniref:Uncharacterized protein n=1 Tax=Psilocybe cyanescens TaxID=93625 RepID=A0A409XKC4_PSICY|nr:hypothetical protein CVT25_001181 [Psilocybe cyanescens]